MSENNSEMSKASTERVRMHGGKVITRHVISALAEMAATACGVLLLVSVFPAKAYGGDDIQRIVPELSPGVAKRAAQAMKCSAKSGKRPSMLIVVDMNKPSREKRLFAIDLKGERLITKGLVAHGRGSDPSFTGVPRQFSNENGSHMTSLGLYQVAEGYEGKHGFARRLDGLMRGWNDKARERAVVIHSSNYVRPGAVGRSQGCPAVSQDTLDALEKAGLGNALMWIDGRDQNLAKAVEHCSDTYKYSPTSYAGQSTNAKATHSAKTKPQRGAHFSWTRDTGVCLEQFPLQGVQV